MRAAALRPISALQIHGRCFLNETSNEVAVWRFSRFRRTGTIARSISMVPAAAALKGNSSVATLIDDLNAKYEKLHLAFEDNFWATKMGLNGASNDALAKTKTDYEGFLSDADNLKTVQEMLKSGQASPEQEHVLKIIEKTFRVNTIEPKLQSVKEKLNKLEAELQQHRGGMSLGYMDAEGKFVKGSSVQLGNTIKINADEAVRKSAWEGMRSIGPHVAEKLCEIVKLRNQLARSGGFEDFYDMKVQGAEGFSKRKLFEIMNGLEKESRPIMEQARQKVATEKGEDALKPWNLSHALAGDVKAELDPYFPFEEAVDVWARTFAALGIHYQGATMRLDLCDRDGKYSNGFCHWPQPAWRRADGTWVPSAANFTSLATPDAVGSGNTALMTLLHEGGHAAHFANIQQYSPFFSQERAPTSVAYAENQSMFLDSLMGDGEWLSRYARSRDGKPVPWELVEKDICATQPYEVFMLRSMLAVPYFEKALYELPDERVTPEEIAALADRIEEEVQGGPAGRPIMAVPHILADESSAYYHGYVLAEMSVHQTRAYFKQLLDGITDIPEVGKQLTEVYWQPGNGAAFLDLVQKLTGKPLSGDAWIEVLREPLDQKLSQEKAGYDAGLAAGPKIPAGQEPDLGMRIQLVHGDEIISDSDQDGGLAAATQKFKGWIRKRYNIKA